MNIHTLHNLQEAYLDVYYDLDEGASSEVSARAAKLARQRKGQTPERKAMYQRLSRLASNRAGDSLASRLPLSRDEIVGMGWDITPASSQRRSEDQTLGGISYHRGPKRVPSKLKKEKRQVQRGVRVAGNARRRQLGLPELSPTQMRKRLGLEDSYDYETYETILSYLLDEGYTDCLGSAEIILENMSDEWLEDILNEAEKIAPYEKMIEKSNKLASGKSKSGHHRSAKIYTALRDLSNKYASSGDREKEKASARIHTRLM